jgi:hypothetical protein
VLVTSSRAVYPRKPLASPCAQSARPFSPARFDAASQSYSSATSSTLHPPLRQSSKAYRACGLPTERHEQEVSDPNKQDSRLIAGSRSGRHRASWRQDIAVYVGDDSQPHTFPNLSRCAVELDSMSFDRLTPAWVRHPAGSNGRTTRHDAGLARRDSTKTLKACAPCSPSKHLFGNAKLIV